MARAMPVRNGKQNSARNFQTDKLLTGCATGRNISSFRITVACALRTLPSCFSSESTPRNVSKIIFGFVPRLAGALPRCIVPARRVHIGKLFGHIPKRAE